MGFIKWECIRNLFLGKHISVMQFLKGSLQMDFKCEEKLSEERCLSQLETRL